VDSVPLQSELQEPSPPRLRAQSCCKGREGVGNIRTLLDFKLKFFEGPQQPEVDLQLRRGDEWGECDGFTDMELRLGDVFRRIVERDSGLRC